jgi:catechol 2,3-dioxygenase-like lactoylglutathione lyase family enzyme
MKRQMAGLLTVASLVAAFAFLGSTHAALNGANTLRRPDAAAALTARANSGPAGRENAYSMISYREPMINYYVKDPERVAAFYREHFGFVETFRTPNTGPSVHIEVTLGTFVAGFALLDAARSMHQLDLDPGKPRGEIAIWTDDVDAAIAAIRSHGVRVLSEPHDFLVDPPLRAAWVEDPEGNPIQIVCKRSDHRK